MLRHNAAFRFSVNIIAVSSAWSVVGTKKLGHGPRYSFRLFQQQKVPGIRQIDDPHPLAPLLAQRMPVPRRGDYVIETLDHEKGGGAGAPPIFEGHVPAGREMRDKDRRPAFDLFQYLGIGCWREPARAQRGDAIAAVHLGLRRIAKGRPERRRGRDEATRRKQRHAANQRWLIDCQTAGDPVAESMSDQVNRTTADRLNDASDVTGQIVQGRAVERTATASDATHINRDRLEPSGNQRARQMIKIAGATARIREQHDWCARTIKCAFQRHVTDLDGTMLLHSHLPLLCRCNHKAGAWSTQTSPISRSVRRITISWMSEATNSPTTGSRPVSSGVTVTVWPGFRPMGSCGSTVALAIDLASLATSSACCALIWLRLPWPIAAMRSAQVRSLGKPSSGAAADPKFCRKNQTG